MVIDWDRVGATSTWASEQVFTHPNHPQPYGAFRPDLSVVDLLCNVGRERSCGAQSAVESRNLT